MLEQFNFKINYLAKNLSTIKTLVENAHYSKTVQSQQQVHCFSLESNGKIVGAAIFGRPMSRHYDLETIELRRFVLIDEMPRNTESFFLSKCLKWLQKHDKTIVRVVTFADPNQGHKGVIYKAANFLFDGEENSANPRVLVYQGKKIHLRQLYQKKKGVYSRDALKFQALVKSKEALIIKQDKKLRYMYYMRK